MLQAIGSQRVGCSKRETCHKKKKKPGGDYAK